MITSLESVMGYLQTDHRRLDGIMEECAKAIAARDFGAGAARFEEFRSGLIRHIKIEEGLLFPVFETVSGLPRHGGPTGVMRHEHAEILRLLGLIGEIFESESPSEPEIESLRSALVALLHDHNGKEERILYPMTDQLAPPDQIRTLVDQMKEFPF